MKKIKLKYLFAISFVLVYFVFFIYIDFSSGAFIRLQPTFSIKKLIRTKRALKLIKEVSPLDYQKISKNINGISFNMLACPSSADGCYNGEVTLNRKQITIQASDIFIDRFFTTGYIAEIITHETCHAIQKLENRKLSEPECYSVNQNLNKLIKLYKKK